MNANLTTLLERAMRIRRLISNELKNTGESQLRLLRLRRLLLLLEQRLQHAWGLSRPSLAVIPVTAGTANQSRCYAR